MRIPIQYIRAPVYARLNPRFNGFGTSKSHCIYALRVHVLAVGSSTDRFIESPSRHDRVACAEQHRRHRGWTSSARLYIRSNRYYTTGFQRGEAT